MQKIYTGKVREVYEDCDHDPPSNPDTHDILYIKTTDNISAFDRVWCTIEGKGKILNQTSKWWFDKTRHIMKNHIIEGDESTEIVKWMLSDGVFVRKCNIYPIEIVVRGYITGSTNTSLWTLYSSSSSNASLSSYNINGLILPKGLKKNQKLDEPVITPTTKSSVHDEPISPAQIVERGIMTQSEWDYISSKALELFKYGQTIALEKGLILVDTKYEFGRDVKTGEVLVCDELHTCDSSRYWKANTYTERMNEGIEPERFDKDLIREWIKENITDPYDPMLTVEIPVTIKERVKDAYNAYYNMLIK